MNFDYLDNEHESYTTEQLPDLSQFYNDYAKAIVKKHKQTAANDADISNSISALASAGDEEALLIANELA